MAWKVTIYREAEEIVVKDEEEADAIVDRETRIHGNRCSVIEIDDEELPETEEDECPEGGDLSDNCSGCVYNVDYHYDKKTGRCIKNK